MSDLEGRLLELKDLFDQHGLAGVRAGLELKSTHARWVESLHPRNHGKFASKPGGEGGLGGGTTTVHVAGGANIHGVSFDAAGNGYVNLGGGAHTHFHPNGTSTTHTHEGASSDVQALSKKPHTHANGSGSQARATGALPPAPKAQAGVYTHPQLGVMLVHPDGSADAQTATGYKHPVPADVVASMGLSSWSYSPGSAPAAPKVAKPGHTYTHTSGSKMVVHNDGTGTLSSTSGGSMTLEPQDVQDELASSASYDDGVPTAASNPLAAQPAAAPPGLVDVGGGKKLPAYAGDKVYKHPQGGTIIVMANGDLMAFDAHGKHKATSATPEKLAAGHGQWKQTAGAGAPAVLDDQLVAGLQSNTPAAPSYPAGAQWINHAGGTVTKQPDGTGTITWDDGYTSPPLGVESMATIEAGQSGTWHPVAPPSAVQQPVGGLTSGSPSLSDALAAATAPGAPKVYPAGTTITNASLDEISVQADGTGILTWADGMTSNLSASGVAKAAGSTGVWTVHPPAVADPGLPNRIVMPDGSQVSVVHTPISDLQPGQQVVVSTAFGESDHEVILTLGEDGDTLQGYDPVNDEPMAMALDDLADIMGSDAGTVPVVQGIAVAPAFGEPLNENASPGVYSDGGSTKVHVNGDGTYSFLGYGDTEGQVEPIKHPMSGLGDGTDSAPGFVKTGPPVVDPSPAAAPSGAAEPGDQNLETWYGAGGGAIVIQPDGSGWLENPNGEISKLDPDNVQYMKGLASWSKGDPDHPPLTGSLAAAPGAPVTPEPPAHADPELVKAAAPMVYPHDYPYPVVKGAPPATALPSPKPIKTVSLRPGDVVVIGDGVASVVGNKKIKGTDPAQHLLTVQLPDGTTQQLTHDADKPMTAVARTPHPTITAAAKKAQAQLDALGQVPTPLPAVKPIGTLKPGAIFTTNGGSAFISINADGKTGTLHFGDGSTTPVGAESAALLLTDPAMTQLPPGSAPPGMVIPTGQTAPVPLVPAGDYVGSGGPGSGTLTVAPDGSGTLSFDGTTAEGAPPMPMDAAHVAGFLHPAPDAHVDPWIPKPSMPTPSGPVLSEQTKAAAKSKAWSSTLLQPGTVVLLPKGGSMTLTAKPGSTPGKGGGSYGLTGIPSADADPSYLKPDGTAFLSITESGGYAGVQMVPKTALKKQGITASVPPAPAPPATHDMPAPLPGVPAGPPTVSTSGWTKIGGQGGSNVGGLFKNADGTEFYVKAPASELHAQNEVLAARLYGAAGITVPNVSIAQLDPKLGLGHTKVGVASQILHGEKNLPTAYKTASGKADLADAFAVHAWLANWDAAGTGKDNMITVNGHLVTVDVGGSLLFRAQGSPKGAAFNAAVTEVDTLRHPIKSPDAAQVFKHVDDAAIKKSVADHVVTVSPEQIDALVDSTVTDKFAAAQLKETLKARREWLAAKYGVELPENIAPKAKLVNLPGQVLVPTPAGVKPSAGELEDGSWMHTTTVKANSLKPGNVISFQGDPGVPYLVTGIAPKPGGGGSGKPMVVGKKNGVGPDIYLFVAAPSSGERDVEVATNPAPGWQPPPPPPPPKAGEKLAHPPLEYGTSGSLGASSKLNAINSTTSRSTSIGNAYARLTPEMKQALASVGLGTKSAFVQHFSGLSGKWDGSSNDHYPDLLAFHRAVALEFAIEPPPAVAKWKNETGDLKKQVDAHFAKYGAAYQAAVRVMYEETQAQLKLKGIEKVQVYRGMSFTSSNAPAWAKKGGEQTVPLRPLSSFTWNEGSAFHGTKISATIPRELIFSINGTGPGTAYENEAVVIGALNEWQVSNPVKMAGMVEETKDGGDEPLDFDWCTDETEDWLKGNTWPYVDVDGDDVTTYAEMVALFPTVDPVHLLDLPVAAAMPEQLRAELEQLRADPDLALPAGPAVPETKGWVGLGG